MIPCDRGSAVDDLSCECALEAPPSSGEIGVVLRQSQDRVQMIGKDNNRVDHEWPLLTGDAKGVAERSDVLDQNGGASIGDRNGAEEGPHPERGELRLSPSRPSPGSAKICGSSWGRLWPARGISARR